MSVIYYTVTMSICHSVKSGHVNLFAPLLISLILFLNMFFKSVRSQASSFSSVELIENFSARLVTVGSVFCPNP